MSCRQYLLMPLFRGGKAKLVIVAASQRKFQRPGVPQQRNGLFEQRQLVCLDLRTEIPACFQYMTQICQQPVGNIDSTVCN